MPELIHIELNDPSWTASTKTDAGMIEQLTGTVMETGEHYTAMIGGWWVGEGPTTTIAIKAALASFYGEQIYRRTYLPWISN